MTSVYETREVAATTSTESTILNVLTKSDDSSRTHFKVGSRKSKLAMVQTE
jgi:hypothetical protein